MLKHPALVYVVTTFLILFCGALPQRSGRQVAEDAKCIEDTKQMAPEQLTLLEELSEQKDKEAFLNVLAIETKSTQDDAESKQSEEEMKIELAKQAESPCGMPAKTQTAINAIKPTQTVKQAKMLSKAMTTTTTTTAKPEIRESAKEELKEPKGTSRSPTAGRMVFPSATAPRMSVDEPQAKTKTTNDGRIVFPKNDINSEEDDRLTEYKEYQMQLAKMSSTSTTTTPAPSTAAVDMPNISTQPPSGNATDPSGRNPKGGIEVVNRGIFDIAPSCKADEIYTNGACHRRA